MLNLVLEIGLKRSDLLVQFDETVFTWLQCLHIFCICLNFFAFFLKWHGLSHFCRGAGWSCKWKRCSYLFVGNEKLLKVSNLAIGLELSCLGRAADTTHDRNLSNQVPQDLVLRLLQALTTGLAASAGPCHARERSGKALISERGQPLSKKTGQAFQLHELLYHRLIVVVCSPLYGWLFCVCLLCCCLLLICLLALRTLL